MARWIIAFIWVCSVSFSMGQCIEGDCVNGYGRLKCDCGYLYEGVFKDGLKVNGTLIKDELTYKGEFEFDQAHGKGRITYKDGSWYEGEFRYSQPDGHGTYDLNNGWVYKGMLKAGNFEGIGAKFHLKSEENYSEFKVGEFKADEMNGIGVYYDNGYTLIGTFEKGKLHGIGVVLSEKEGNWQLLKFKKGKPSKSYKRFSENSWKVTLDDLEYHIQVSDDSQSITFQIVNSNKKLTFWINDRKTLININGESGGGVMMDEEGNQHK